MNDLNRFLGLEYKINGRDFKGVDCYGLYYLFQKEQLNNDVPLNVDDKLHKSRSFKEVYDNYIPQFEVTDSPNYGDLIIFKRPHGLLHVAIFLDNNNFLHILDKNYTSQIENYKMHRYKDWIRKRLYYARYRRDKKRER